MSRRGKKTNFSFNFYIVKVGGKNAWLGSKFFDTVFINPEHILCISLYKFFF